MGGENINVIHLLNSFTTDGSSSTLMENKNNNEILISLQKELEKSYNCNPQAFISNINHKFYNSSNSGKNIHFSLFTKILQIISGQLDFFIPGAGVKSNKATNTKIQSIKKTENWNISVLTVYCIYKLLNWLLAFLLSSNMYIISLPSVIFNHFQNLSELYKNADKTIVSHENHQDSAFLRKQFLESELNYYAEYKSKLKSDSETPSEIQINSSEAIKLLSPVMRLIEDTISANRRENGLFNSFNLVKLSSLGITVHPLPLTLEGQNFIISSGFLSPSEVMSNIESQTKLKKTDQENRNYDLLEEYIPRIHNKIELQKFLYLYKKRIKASQPDFISNSMGISVENGCICFNSAIITQICMAMNNIISFAHFGIPITYHFIEKKSAEAIHIKKLDGNLEKLEGTKIDYESSQKIISHDDSIESIEVFFYRNVLSA